MVNSLEHSASSSGQGCRALEVAAIEMVYGRVYLAHRSVSDRGLDEWQVDYSDLTVSDAIQGNSRGGRSSLLRRFEISRRCIGSLQAAPIRLALVSRLRTRRSILAHSGQGYDPKRLPIGTRALFEQLMFFYNDRIATMMLVNELRRNCRGNLWRLLARQRRAKGDSPRRN